MNEKETPRSERFGVSITCRDEDITEYNDGEYLINGLMMVRIWMDRDLSDILIPPSFCLPKVTISLWSVQPVCLFAQRSEKRGRQYPARDLNATTHVAIMQFTTGVGICLLITVLWPLLSIRRSVIAQYRYPAGFHHPRPYFALEMTPRKSQALRLP